MRDVKLRVVDGKKHTTHHFFAFMTGRDAYPTLLHQRLSASISGFSARPKIPSDSTSKIAIMVGAERGASCLTLVRY
jgi:hypothetical protein